MIACNMLRCFYANIYLCLHLCTQLVQTSHPDAKAVLFVYRAVLQSCMLIQFDESTRGAVKFIKFNTVKLPDSIYVGYLEYGSMKQVSLLCIGIYPTDVYGKKLKDFKGKMVHVVT